MNAPILLVNEHCNTGENPFWDHEKRCVYWTDIPNGRLFRYDIDTGNHAAIYNGQPVGGFTMQADGALLLFRVDDIAVLREDGTAEPVIRYTDAGMTRFNDVIADPDGRVRQLFSGTGCANGMGFAPDLRTFYWTCSTRRRIYRFHYDRETGDLSGEDLWYQATPEEGIPDGLAVDVSGNVWSARWDGGAVIKHDPDGQVLEKLEFPVAKVSSLCFGGRDLDSLFVTTAGGKPESATEDGALYLVEVPVLGMPEFRSRILE
jgi:sugar lactone lactonase YvrE